MRRGRTCEGWPDHRGNPLEHEQEAKGICQLVKTQQIDEDHASQTNIGSTGDSENGAVNNLPVVGGHEAAESHGDATENKAGVVEVESVDDALVAQPAKEESSEGVCDADYREKERRLLFLDVPASRPVHRVHIRHVEADACQEVADRVHEKDGIFEETEVNHLTEDPSILVADVAAADLGVLLATAELPRLRGNLSHRPPVCVRVVPEQHQM